MDGPINESQYGQLLVSLTKLGNQDNGGSANTSMLAGIGMCLLSILDVERWWIIDSGASDHIAPHVFLLQHFQPMNTPKFVTMPDGY